MEALKYMLVILGGYFLGSVSMSIIMSKCLLGGDVRKKGSGNAGATNMARVYGMKAGFFTLLGDIAKAGLTILIGWMLLGDWGIAVGGFACLVGHCFPIYYGFKGGKGVSAGAAIALALDWKVFLIAMGIFALIALTTKKVSLGSICAAMSIMITSFIFSLSTPKLILAVAAPALVIVQHRENIKRLINGTEKDFKAGHSPKKRTSEGEA